MAILTINQQQLLSQLSKAYGDALICLADIHPKMDEIEDQLQVVGEQIRKYLILGAGEGSQELEEELSARNGIVIHNSFHGNLKPQTDFAERKDEENDTSKMQRALLSGYDYDSISDGSVAFIGSHIISQSTDDFLYRAIDASRQYFNDSNKGG